ncbi:MAG: hypothetical protein NZL96_02625 [Patescibacteria group bacterium]|nr:hypothetical protein [Patescibacteria group bacterium]
MIKRTSSLELLVSSDSLGIFGTAEQFLFLWEETFKRGVLSGVELIGFRPIRRIKKFIEKLGQKKIKVLSIHGRTGLRSEGQLTSTILLRILDLLIASYNELVFNYLEIDLLLHSTYAGSPQVKEEILSHPPKRLWIENAKADKDFRELDQTLKLVDFFRKNRIDCRAMLDLYHAFAFKTHREIVKEWFSLFKRLRPYLKNFDGIHLPVGTRISDSLPIDLIDESRLSFLREEILSKASRVVIENQQAGTGLLFSSTSSLTSQKQRNLNILRKLFFIS